MGKNCLHHKSFVNECKGEHGHLVVFQENARVLKYIFPSYLFTFYSVKNTVNLWLILPKRYSMLLKTW